MTDSPVFLSESRSNCELSACGLKLNIGRQRLTEAEFESLLQKAKDCGLLERQIKMMQGEVVNASENRQALHTSLRSEDHQAPHFQEVNITRQRMYDLARAVRNGQWLGATGKRITETLKRAAATVGSPLRLLRKYYSSVLGREVSRAETWAIIEAQVAFFVTTIPADIPIIIRLAACVWMATIKLRLRVKN